MFVDIVGYSNTVETRRPEEVFYDLKKILNELTGIVHSHGGVVDRILGDGILAFFGYQYDGGTSTRAHADVGVKCALTMQRQNVRRSSTLTGKSEPVHLLRIGLNTEHVYFGNLGDNYMIDVTLIGRGVNFASRLESACIPNNILISAATRDLLSTVDLEGASLSKIYVPIKHLEEPVEAYDIDPFATTPKVRLAAEEAHRLYIGQKRSDNRWPVPRELAIILESPLTDGDLVNFSESGLGVVLNRFLGRGITSVFNLSSKVPAIDSEIETSGFRQIIGEIRWGRPLPGGRFIQGILIKSLLPNQKELLYEMLRKHLKEGREFSDH